MADATAPPSPRVGVVVIGRNEGDRLVRCLDSLAPLRLPVVYVDSTSTDGSREAAATRGAEVVALDPALPFTAARARNEGFARLQAFAPDIVYVQFVDGDCEVDSDWISHAIAFLDAHPAMAIACGRRQERFPDASLYNRVCDIEWNTPAGEAAACGGDSVARSSAFVAIGGFDPAMIAGEEPEMCSRMRRAGWGIWRLDAAMTVHDAALEHWWQWWRRAVRSGFGYAQAWATTHRSGHALYGRELARIIGWTVILPIGTLAGAVLLDPALLTLAPATYAAQIIRMAARDGVARRFSWMRAVLLTVGKFAELQGMLRYIGRTLARQTGGAIFYK